MIDLKTDDLHREVRRFGRQVQHVHLKAPIHPRAPMETVVVILNLAPELAVRANVKKGKW